MSKQLPSNTMGILEEEEEEYFVIVNKINCLL
jgi:hypothetical protein